MVIKKSYEILKILLKDVGKKHTVTSLSKERKISRVGSWKLLQDLEKENLILTARVGSFHSLESRRRIRRCACQGRSSRVVADASHHHFSRRVKECC